MRVFFAHKFCPYLSSFTREAHAEYTFPVTHTCSVLRDTYGNGGELYACANTNLCANQRVIASFGFAQSDEARHACVGHTCGFGGSPAE